LSKISAIIITRNESENIRRCLQSLSWTDEMVVVDAQSTDDTKNIASQFTSKVFDLEWEGFGAAKRFAKNRASGEWILSVDADEVVSDKLREEIQRTISSQDPLEGYYLPRGSSFLGRWIKHGGWYPDWVLRLFKKDKGEFTPRLVHEEVKVRGRCGYLKNHLLHYTDPDFEHYLRKLNQYTSLSALQLSREGKKAGLWGILLRPPATFVKMYFLRRGFLDGREGFILAVSSAFHVFAKYVKLCHLNRSKTNYDSR
jgi:glycosyltransferase involved in cell wall biosynthesis